MIRETYYGALFALLQNLAAGGAFATCGRRLRFLHEMGAAELPALFMAVDRQQLIQRRGQPARHQFGARLFVYAANPDPRTAAGIALNGLLDALDAALAPSAGGETQTLGGIVSHCWIEGPVEVYEAPQGERAAAIVPVTMLVP